MWTAILTVQAGAFLQRMIEAIWPSFINFPNHLPANAGITSAGILCFMLYWMIQTGKCKFLPTSFVLMSLATSCVSFSQNLETDHFLANSPCHNAYPEVEDFVLGQRCDCVSVVVRLHFV